MLLLHCETWETLVSNVQIFSVQKMGRKVQRQYQEIGEDFQTLCRLCLKKSSLKIDMYEDDERPRDIPGKILNCLTLKVTEDDRLPKFVCMTCIDKLDNFQEFRDMCHESETLLNDYISQVEECKERNESYKASSASTSLQEEEIEAGSKQELDTDESHSPPPRQPAPDFVTCTVKAEPEDVPFHDETDAYAWQPEPSSSVKSEQVLVKLDSIEENPSHVYVNIDAGTSEFGQEESEHLGPSDSSVQFEDSSFEDSDGNKVEIESEEVKETELKIESEGPAAEEEGYLSRNPVRRIKTHIFMDNSEHFDSRCVYQLPDTKVQDVNTSQSTFLSALPLSDIQHLSNIRHSTVYSETTEKLGETARSLNPKRVFTCNECDRVFTTKGWLGRHMRSHSGEKPFLCLACYRGFAQKSQLKIHSRIHTGERPFVCSTCSKAFIDIQALECHSRIHTGVKPYVCSMWNKTFTHKGTLPYHLTIHTSVKLHVCSICNKSFKDSKHLQNHLRIHTGYRRFVCPICYKAFVERVALIRHLRFHTGTKSYAYKI